MALLAIVVAMQQDRNPPDFSATEAAIKRQLESKGGELDWVREEGKWLLCLDVQNDKKTFNLRSIEKLNRLFALRIFRGEIEPKSFAVIPKLPNLGLLVTLSHGLGDVELGHICRSKSISKLDFSSETVTIKGLEELAEMPKLRRLFLHNVKMSDSALEAIKSLTKLEDLSVPKSISDSALANLKRALPNTDIDRLQPNENFNEVGAYLLDVTTLATLAGGACILTKQPRSKKCSPRSNFAFF